MEKYEKWSIHPDGSQISECDGYYIVAMDNDSEFSGFVWYISKDHATKEGARIICDAQVWDDGEVLLINMHDITEGAVPPRAIAAPIERVIACVSPLFIPDEKDGWHNVPPLGMGFYGLSYVTPFARQAYMPTGKLAPCSYGWEYLCVTNGIDDPLPAAGLLSRRIEDGQVKYAVIDGPKIKPVSARDAALRLAKLGWREVRWIEPQRGVKDTRSIAEVLREGAKQLAEFEPEHAAEIMAQVEKDIVKAEALLKKAEAQND